MERDELVIRHRLVTSEEWQEIRKRALDKVVKLSKGASEPLIIQGMLNLIDDVDIWEEDFQREHEKFVNGDKR